LTIKSPLLISTNEHQISDGIPKQNRGRRAQGRLVEISEKVRWTASPLAGTPRKVDFEAVQVVGAQGVKTIFKNRANSLDNQRGFVKFITSKGQ